MPPASMLPGLPVAPLRGQHKHSGRDLAQKLGVQARDLDRALALQVGLSPPANGGLALLVRETSQNREAVHKILDETLQRFEARQLNALCQHMQYVSQALVVAGGTSGVGSARCEDPLVSDSPLAVALPADALAEPPSWPGLTGRDAAARLQASQSPRARQSARSSPRPRRVARPESREKIKDKGNKMRASPAFASRDSALHDDGLSGGLTKEAVSAARSEQPPEPQTIDHEMAHPTGSARDCAEPRDCDFQGALSEEENMFVEASRAATPTDPRTPLAAAQPGEEAHHQDELLLAYTNRQNTDLSRQTPQSLRRADARREPSPRSSMPQPSRPASVCSSVDSLSERKQAASGSAMVKTMTVTPKSVESIDDWRKQTYEDVGNYALVEALHRGTTSLPQGWQGTARRALNWCTEVLNSKEPTRTGRLAHIVQSTKFEVLCVVVIFINVIATTASQETEMMRLRGQGLDWSEEILILETLFLVWYTIELGLKIAVHGRFFFICDSWRWNAFDTTLVLLSMLDLGTSWAIQKNYSQAQSLPIELRILRIAKFARIIRVMRAFRFLEELRLMLDLCMVSLISIFWALLMITLVLYMASLFFMEGVVARLQDKPEDLERISMFDGLPNTMVTLLQVTTGGIDWIEPYLVLETFGRLYGAGLILYILFFNLVLLNVVTSVFLDRVMKFAEPSPEVMVAERKLIEERDIRALADMIKRIDGDGDGVITFEEFKQCMHMKQFGTFLASRGIDIKEARAFFSLVAERNASGEVDVGDFVRSCHRMKGNATAVDLQILRQEVCDHYRKIVKLIKETSRSQP